MAPVALKHIAAQLNIGGEKAWFSVCSGSSASGNNNALHGMALRMTPPAALATSQAGIAAGAFITQPGVAYTCI